MPSRPTFGWLDHTRLAPGLSSVELVSERRIRRSVKAATAAWRPDAIHALAHSMDFWPTAKAAHESGVPLLLTVHDDLRYALRNSPVLPLALRRLSQVWNYADARFVITEQLGREYNRRYGAHDFAVVTDGLEEVSDFRPAREGLGAYFMGAYHASYKRNFETLLGALTELQSRLPPDSVSLTLRGGGLPYSHDTTLDMRVLGFGTQAEVAEEAAAATFLYLPLPFGRPHRDFVRWSLSTKLVTYLGSGRPILYHGPEGSAAAELLVTHGAAAPVYTLESRDLVAGIDAVVAQETLLSNNALELARSQFMLERTRRVFIDECGRAVDAASTGPPTPPPPA